MSAFHFISGLPRSGSTLLAALLRQNPYFHASIMSPVGYMVSQLQEAMSNKNEAVSYLNNDIRVRSLRAVFAAYYADKRYPYTIFDSNRRWLANLDLLNTLFPRSIVITMVRPVADIVESFERSFSKHPEQLSAIIAGTPNTNIYMRTSNYMEPLNVIGYAYASLKDAYFGANREKLLLVEYDELCNRPLDVLKAIHDLLSEPMFDYRLNDITEIPGAQEFDKVLGSPGLHSIRPTLSYVSHPLILPPDLRASLPKPFWRPVKEVATDAR